jgi:ribosomal-protein-alanine N-acetyltransferase
MSAASIDRMTEIDIEPAAEIESQSFSQRESGARGVDRFKEELARPWSRAFVARDDAARITGFLLSWHVVDELHILDVAVAPASRRHGIGRALVAAAIDYAKKENAVRLLLEVRPSNAVAIALYRALGFLPYGVRKRYYSDDEDALEMMLTLGD